MECRNFERKTSVAECRIPGGAPPSGVAIEPLKRLLPLNLNRVLGGGGSGTGRPEAFALARLGDLSGVEILRASIRKGDRLGVVGFWGDPGDFVAIGRKSLIRELLPALDHRAAGKRVLAAQVFLLLFESGR